MSKRHRQKAWKTVTAKVPDDPGLLFILSAPSGAGKSTLCHAVLKRFPDIYYSISYTTRPPRAGERDGVDYHFIDSDDFEKGIARNRWAEWAKVHHNYYGTSANLLNRALAKGQDVLLDIDVQGMRQIVKRYPAGITIFIMPPSLEILRIRLEKRGTDSPENIALRLKNAQKEMALKDLYRHVVNNDQLTESVAELLGIFEKYRS
jgi:guanylate kinase